MRNRSEECCINRIEAPPKTEVEEADATHFEDLVPEDVKQARYERFMEVQQAISAQKLEQKVGQTLEVIIDDYNEEPGQLIGRSKADAPGIDGNVYCVHGELAESDAARQIPAGSIKIGDIVRVYIEAADEYDLFGEVVEVVKWQPNIPQIQKRSIHHPTPPRAS